MKKETSNWIWIGIAVIAVLFGIGMFFEAEGATAGCRPDTVTKNTNQEFILTIWPQKKASVITITVPTNLGKPDIKSKKETWFSWTISKGEVIEVETEGQNIILYVSGTDATTSIILKYGSKNKKNKGVKVKKDAFKSDYKIIVDIDGVKIETPVTIN